MRLALLACLLLLPSGCGGYEGPVPGEVPADANLGELDLPEVFWADPSVIQSCDDDLGITTLHWKTDRASRVEIRVGMPEGELFALANPEGSKQTGNWVKDGMVFYLVDADTRAPLAACRVRVTRAGCPN
jgi:hypothetical protein